MQEKLMLVGEAAKRLKVSVRTLQYYDREKLCSPCEYSEGGRRLYCDKDIVKLHQILSMKYLGLSLEQIKNNLSNIGTAEDVVQMLKAQREQITKQIENLSNAKNAINNLIEEVVAMDKVDWYKYASIVEMLKAGDSNYWIVKHFKNKTVVSAANKFDKKSAEKFVSSIEEIWDSFGLLIDGNIAPDSEQSMALAQEMWDMVIDFSGGDKEILQDTLKFGDCIDSWKNENWKKKFSKIQEYSGKALESYFVKYNVEVGL